MEAEDEGYEEEAYEEDYFEEDLIDSFEGDETEEADYVENDPKVSQYTVVKNLQMFVLCLVICMIIACVYAIVRFNWYDLGMKLWAGLTRWQNTYH